MKVTVRVWKVTEYDVTMEVEDESYYPVTRQAMAMAEQGHTTDFEGVPGVINRGTFPSIRRIRRVRDEDSEGSGREQGAESTT